MKKILERNIHHTPNRIMNNINGNSTVQAKSIAPPPFRLFSNSTLTLQREVDSSTNNDKSPSAEDAHKKEIEFSIKGGTIYNKLKESYKIKKDVADNLTKAGDSEAKLEGMPDWFDQLQSIMARNPVWNIETERASWLLKEYALWHFQTKLGMPQLPANVQTFFNYLGMGNMGEKSGQTNQKAYQEFYKSIDLKIERLEAELNNQLMSRAAEEKQKIVQEIQDLKRAKANPHDVADLHAKGGMWCGAAATAAIKKSYEGKNVQFPSNWDAQSSYNEVIGDNSKAYNVESAEAGDTIIIIGSKTPATGHVMTFIRKDGDKIQAVSGNAGFASVRIDTLTYEQPPAGYSRWTSKDLESRYEALKKAHPTIAVDIQEAEKELAGINKSQAVYDTDSNVSNISTAEQLQLKIAELRKIQQEIQLLEDRIPSKSDHSKSISDKPIAPEKRWFPESGKTWVVAIVKTSRVDANKNNSPVFEDKSKKMKK